MNSSLIRDHEPRFEFGRNWAEYSKTITEADISAAEAELKRLLGTNSLTGMTFLDIGCGSGIHALAALRMGADFVHGVDIDQDSVDTSVSLIGTHWDKDNCKIERANLLTMSESQFGTFDIVYSWGVLHHTGDLWAAIHKASNFVKPEGLLAIAIYRKTRLCRFWSWEKRRFTSGSPLFRRTAILLFVAMRVLRDVIRLKNPMRKIQQHSSRKRGMKWYTDVVDWLGGYPYESATFDEVRDFVENRGFQLCRSFKTKEHTETGFFGAGNAEYVFQAVARRS